MTRYIKTCIICLMVSFIVPLIVFGQDTLKSIPVYQNIHYSFPERAADLVSRMTLEEEVLQLRTNHAPAIRRLSVQDYRYWNECQHGVAGLYGILPHEENGDTLTVHATSFPTNFAAAMSWDPTLIYEETCAVSDEARGFLDKSLWNAGINKLGSSRANYGSLTYWSPTINMDRDPRWGRTDEAFGEDPFLASVMAEAYVNGLQGQTMEGQPMTKYLKAAATAKHYALNNFEDDRFGGSSDADDETLRNYYMVPFRNLIENAGVAGLMTAYNAINGTPAVANTYTINELAGRTWGFDGYITSDCGAVSTTYHEPPHGHAWAPPGWVINNPGDNATWTNKRTGVTISAAAGGQAYAVRAGTALNCTGAEYTLSNVKEAIKAGILSKGVIDRALARVFTIRMRTGEFDPPDQIPYTHITKSVIGNPAHQKLAEKVAENSLVLLKNNPLPLSTKRLLPAEAAGTRHIVILGNLANEVSLGGYSGRPSLQVSAVQGITTAVKRLNPAAEITFYGAETSTTAKTPAVLTENAKTAIRNADLVIVFAGTDETVAREGLDRKSLSMPGNYDSMIGQVAALGNHRMVLVIQSDGPLNIEHIKDKFPAIVFSGYNGESQGTALAKVLLGQENPSGHLNFTWYKDESQLPDISNYALTPEKTGGLGRTYMYFTGKPTHPFGFGLSYSRFKYSHMTVSADRAHPDDQIQIGIQVTNTGEVTGATVAQLYVDYPGMSGKQNTVRRLKGFQKTKTLQPGQTQHISLTVKLSDLALWNKEKRKNMVYNGTYKFRIGYNSDQIAASKKIDILGKLSPKIACVTVQPSELIYYVGDTLNLNGKNEWIESDVSQTAAHHSPADHIIEAANNDGSFVDLRNIKISYKSSDVSVAKIDSEGIIKFIRPGTVTISANVDGMQGSTAFVLINR